MTLENPGLSRRKLLRTTAIGVPAAGMLAFWLDSRDGNERECD